MNSKTSSLAATGFSAGRFSVPNMRTGRQQMVNDLTVTQTGTNETHVTRGSRVKWFNTQQVKEMKNQVTFRQGQGRFGRIERKQDSLIANLRLGDQADLGAEQLRAFTHFRNLASIGYVTSAWVRWNRIKKITISNRSPYRLGFSEWALLYTIQPLTKLLFWRCCHVALKAYCAVPHGFKWMTLQ